jgi:hypothetical protein
MISPISVDESELEQIREEINDRIGRNIHLKTVYLIAAVSRVLDEHKQYGGKLTVRQVYYQLVTKGVIENSKSSYPNYDHHLTTGRKAGVIPWDAFEDRARSYYKEKEPVYDLTTAGTAEDEMKSFFRGILSPSVPKDYDFPMWKNQPYYVELWVEKDALAGFLSPICERLGVGLVVSRGYTSYTFKAEAQKRFDRVHEVEKRIPVLLYLGDLDPSGYDIYRCLKDELDTVIVMRIGLNVEDVSQFSLVPNPIKHSDRRANGFRRLFPELGDNVYELDALPPGELMDRARRSIHAFFDDGIHEENQRKVRHWRANLTDYQKSIKKVLRKAGIKLN